MKPIVLISDFLGTITLPHYTKFKDHTNSFDAGVVYDKDHPLNDGDYVTLYDLNKNTRVFVVSSTDGHRLAKGDWAFKRPKEVMFCTLSATLVGYWNPIKEHQEGGVVSPEYISDKKAAA
jgi:hypothetical protein